MTTFRRAFVTTFLLGLAAAGAGLGVLTWPYWRGQR